MFHLKSLLRNARKTAPFVALLFIGLSTGCHADDARPDDAAPDAPVAPNKLPTLWLIGDSTVKNARPDYVGWGDPVADYFDKTKINIENRALGGRSSRTYISEGLWAKVLGQVKAGDFVMIQFGHNDAGEPAKIYRATFEGNKDDAQTVVNPKTKKSEEVHTFGWYIRQYIGDTKAKGATPILLSPVPHKDWKAGKIARNWQKYARYSGIIAKQNETAFINLDGLIADKYDALGEEKVADFFIDERTHTNAAGAQIAAEAVVEGINALPDFALRQYLTAEAKNFTAAKPRTATRIQPTRAPVTDEADDAEKNDE